MNTYYCKDTIYRLTNLIIQTLSENEEHSDFVLWKLLQLLILLTMITISFHFDGFLDIIVYIYMTRTTEIETYEDFRSDCSIQRRLLLFLRLLFSTYALTFLPNNSCVVKI